MHPTHSLYSFHSTQFSNRGSSSLHLGANWGTRRQVPETHFAPERQERRTDEIDRKITDRKIYEQINIKQWPRLAHGLFNFSVW
jgi:hypothetical protein